MRESFLIDDNGQVHQADSLLLRQQTGGLWTGDAFGVYAVCNLGFVGGRSHERALHLLVRPASVTAEAYVQAIYMLRDLAPGRRVVVSRWSEGRFNDEVHADGTSAAEALTRHVACRHARARARLKSSEIGLAEAPLRFTRCLGAIESANSDAIAAIAGVSEACEHRYIVFERTSSCFMLHSFGANNPPHARRWFTGNEGAPLKKDLDIEYSWFCYAAYRRALAQNRPLVEAVDAMVELPERQSMRRQYHRLVVPLRTASGLLVLVATVEDRSIDLLAA